MIRSLLLMTLLVYLGFGAYLYLFQRAFIYHPVAAPPDLGLEALQVDSDGERIRVWRANPGRNAALVYFGGNAEAVAYGVRDLAALLPRHTLYLVDYRGYGASTGRPSEAALYRDALAVFDRVQAGHARVDVLGRSLGSGVATYLAAQRPVARLGLVTPFASLARLARELYPVYPVGLLLRERFDSLARAPAIAAPTLIVIAAEDRQIPPRHAHALAAGFAATSVEVSVIPGANHFSVTAKPEYAAALRRFFAAADG